MVYGWLLVGWVDGLECDCCRRIRRNGLIQWTGARYSTIPLAIEQMEVTSHYQLLHPQHTPLPAVIKRCHTTGLNPSHYSPALSNTVAAAACTGTPGKDPLQGNPVESKDPLQGNMMVEPASASADTEVDGLSGTDHFLAAMSNVGSLVSRCALN